MDGSKNWNNTAIYRPYQPVFNATGFQTNAALGFTITDNAVFGLAQSFSTDNEASYAGYQMQYVLTACVDTPFDITCQNREVSCDTKSVVAADLITVTEPCGAVSVTSGGQSEIALDFSSTKAVSLTLDAVRFDATAQCQVTISCTNEVVPAAVPSATPSGKTPVTNVTSGGAINSLPIVVLVFALVLALLQ